MAVPLAVDEPDILGPRSFGAPPFLIFDGLPHAEGLDRSVLQRGMMEEDVASFPLDETEALCPQSAS